MLWIVGIFYVLVAVIFIALIVGYFKSTPRKDRFGGSKSGLTAKKGSSRVYYENDNSDFCDGGYSDD